MEKPRIFTTTALIVCVLSAGCAHFKKPSAGEVEIERIELGALPVEARFAPIGSSGTAYRVRGGSAGEVRLPADGGAFDALLPETVRLFRWVEGRDRWTEIESSRYDVSSRALVGKGLGPGLYTAAGWSANPAENALQRILLDASLGYGGFTSLPTPGPGGEQSIDGFRRDALLIWMEFSFTYQLTTCGAKDEPGCPLECRRAATHGVVLSSCRVDGVRCPEPDCCDCATGSVTERALIPKSIFDVPRLPCRGPGSIFPCPICPRGLSCPEGPFVQDPRIAPTGDRPDYAFLDGLGAGVVTEDPVLRDDLHALVEAVTGNEYPVPPPWP